MSFFVVVSDQGENAIFALNRPLLCIGRREKTCDYVLDNPGISRLHLIVRCHGDKTYLTDNHTKNGTYVNGERLSGERELADGDRIEVCDVVLEFHATMSADQLAP